MIPLHASTLYCFLLFALILTATALNGCVLHLAGRYTHAIHICIESLCYLMSTIVIFCCNAALSRHATCKYNGSSCSPSSTHALFPNVSYSLLLFVSHPLLPSHLSQLLPLLSRWHAIYAYAHPHGCLDDWGILFFASI